MEGKVIYMYITCDKLYWYNVCIIVSSTCIIRIVIDKINITQVSICCRWTSLQFLVKQHSLQSVYERNVLSSEFN